MKHTVLLWFALLAGILLAGCGGGSNLTKSTAGHLTPASLSGSSAKSRSGKGQATVTVKWPVRSGGSKSAHSRLIPGAANSIKVALTSGGTAVASTLLTRPTDGAALVSTYTFQNLALGSLTATATAFPNADGSGTAQAAASNTLAIVDGQTTPLNLTMNSTVTSIVVSGAASVKAHHTTAMTASALDAQGNIVLVGGTIAFTSSNTANATIDPVTGVVTGISVGAITLTATYQEANVVVMTGTQSVAVTPNTPDAIYYSNGSSTIKRITSLTDTSPQSLVYNGMSVRQMVVDSAGGIYVADGNNSQVLKFANMTDTTPQTLTYSGMSPIGITLHNGAIYVADSGNSRVLQFTGMTDTNPQILTYSGMNARTVAVDSANAIYVLDASNARVLKFANMTDTNPQSTTFTLSDPRGIGLDSTDKLYVAEHSGAKIYKFANIQDTEPQSITLANVSSGAHGIALYDNSIYVANPHGSNLLGYVDFADTSPGSYVDSTTSFQTVAVQ